MYAWPNSDFQMLAVNVGCADSERETCGTEQERIFAFWSDPHCKGVLWRDQNEDSWECEVLW